MRAQKALALAVGLTLALASACSKSTGTTQDAGTDAISLAVVGNAVLTLHPGDVRNLKVVLAQTQCNSAVPASGVDAGLGCVSEGTVQGGPIPDAAIHFQFDDEDPAGAQLDTSDAVTAADGTAGFKLTAGARGTFKVIASAPDYPNVRSVAFSVNVITVRKLIQIVGSPQVRVSSDAQSATVTMYISSSVGLKVQILDQDTGNPIAGESLLFSLPSGAHASLSGGSSPSAATITTSATGTAQVFLVSTNIVDHFLVSAQDAAGGVSEVSFSVTVQTNSSGATCTGSAQCPAGQICVSGVCTTDTGGGSCTVGNDNGCPFGYQCVNGTCQAPNNPSCDPNNPAATCPAGDTCVCTGTGSAQVCQCEPICGACPPGEICVVTGNTGTCTPAPGTTPDLSGIWYTRHSFSIEQALPTVIQDIQKAVRIIDQLIQGQFFSGFWAWLNPIVSGIIDTYVPAWVRTIIEVLDDIGTIFSNLRSVGSMRMTQTTDTSHFKGTEVWTSFVFYWLPLCNGQIGGNNYTPPCARFDVATTDSTDPGTGGTCAGQALPTISVQVAPFTASIAQASNSSPWVVTVADRKVQLKMGKLILVALNLLISYLTPYSCIDDALNCSPGNPCLLDCPSFGSFIDQVTGGFFSASAAEAVCDVAANLAGHAVTGLLANLSFSADTLDFAGHALVGADGSAAGDCDNTIGNPCASQLGNDNYDNDLQSANGRQDGSWSGNFFFNVVGCDPNHPTSSCLPGAWEALRTPVQ